MEIIDIRLLLPATVSFKIDNEEHSVFIYIDQMKKDIIIPDFPEGINFDFAEFKNAFAKFYNLKNPAVKIPMPPKTEFQDIKIKEF